MNVQEKTFMMPKVGLFACFSGGSNTGSLTGMAALEVVRRLSKDIVGICSLPAILNEVPRQTAMVKKIGKIVVIDGCHNACARKLLAKAGIKPSIYLNLEEDLGMAKSGPFTSLEFTDHEVKEIVEALMEAI